MGLVSSAIEVPKQTSDTELNENLSDGGYGRSISTSSSCSTSSHAPLIRQPNEDDNPV